jgi:predicted nucleic acid-binding protein
MTEYLLDTCIVLEILQGNEKTLLWLKELNGGDTISISGWTALELLKEKRSKQEMEVCLRNILAKSKLLWTKPEFCDEIPDLLIREGDKQRDNNLHVKRNFIFDCFIYKTAKSEGTILVTRDKGFKVFNDIEILFLQDNPRYKLENLGRV